MKQTVSMNGMERDRMVVLRQAQEGKLTQKAAAEQLGLSARWVKKLAKRMREEGDQGLVHRLRGRRSNRGHSAEVRQQALALVRERYHDYGPTLASEMLQQEQGITVNRETLRQWMSRGKLWKPKRAKVTQVHVWRQRRRQRGELVQWDTSEHDWLEGRGPKLYLVAMIDDATSEVTARFTLSDSTAENMRLLRQYVEQHGRPVDVYTDKASLFQVNRPLHYNKHLDGKPEPTQIERALAELSIGRIAAHSPQAKGRVERLFGTLQDRLVKALRRAGANDLEGANEYLQREFVPEWNRRFQKAASQECDAHRPLRDDQQLESILSYVEQRTVSNDYTIAWRGKRYQVPSEQAQPRMRRQAVRVEQRLNGELWACWQKQQIRLKECVEAVAHQKTVVAPPKPAMRPKGKPSRIWMNGFWAGDPGKRRPVLGDHSILQD